MTTQDIFDALSGLNEPDYDVHITKDAWYSARAITRCFGGDFKDLPSVDAVRVSLRSGMLELHPDEENKVNIMCYCCFGGDPDRGTFDLSELKDAVVSLKDHYCPPWPG